MVASLTAAELREANSLWLPDFIKYVSGWEKRTNGSVWRDVTGYMVHHTGDDAKDSISLNVLIYGHASLPGPLCTEAIGDAGTVWQVAIGPANHAGGGDPDVLAAVRAESYGDYPPKTDKHHGEAGSVSGNPVFYGAETMYGNDAEPKPHPIQYRSMVVVAASRIWALDKKDKVNTWSSKSTIGHKEWSDWKPDPRGVDMAKFRQDVQWCLNAGPAATRHWHKTGEKENDVALTKEDIERLLHSKDADLILSPMFENNNTVTPATALRWTMQWSLEGRNDARAAGEAVEKTAAKVEELATRLDALAVVAEVLVEKVSALADLNVDSIVESADKAFRDRLDRLSVVDNPPEPEQEVSQ